MSGPDRAELDRLRAMDTEALRSLLLIEMSADEELNIAQIQTISDILAEREQIEVPDTNEAWREFQEIYRSSEPLYTLEQEAPKSVHKTKLRGLRRLAILAAVVASLLAGASLTAYAAEYDLWGAVAKWTNDTFSFVYEHLSGHSETSKPCIAPELQPLWDAMLDAGVEEPLLPTMLPDGYKQVDFVDEKSQGFLYVMYQSGEKNIIQMQVHLDAIERGVSLEKSEVSPDLYVWNNIECYIVTNFGQKNATWTSDSDVYMISGATESELYQMIESIPMEGVK